MTRNEHDANLALAERASQRQAARRDDDEWHRTWDGIIFGVSGGLWVYGLAIAVAGYFLTN